MGVITTAEENIDTIRENLSIVISKLSEIVVDECMGYKDYGQEYLDNLAERMMELIKIKSKI